MNTAEGAVDTAEAWHARYLAPYGDGGAPWHAEIGLGTDQRRAADPDKEWTHFDPALEACEQALLNRTQPLPGLTVGSPVRPLILRPGESFNIVRGGAIIQRLPVPRAKRTRS
jgi:hypothetical protein